MTAARRSGDGWRWILSSALRAVPIVSLVVLAVLVVLALFGEPPVERDFEEPPVGAPLQAPDLGLGDLTLVARIVDDSGRPVADAGVVAVQEDRPLWAWTDADGRFELRDLRAPTTGPLEVELRIVARGFEVETTSARAGAPEQVLVLERRIGVAPDLAGLDALDLAGQISFTTLETPEEGYELALLPLLSLDDLAAGLPRRVRVAADGTFRVEALIPGEYELVLLPPEARGGRWPNLLAGADGVAPRHLQPAPGGGGGDGGQQPLQLTLSSRAGALGGRLADTRRPGGAKWLEGALVLVEPIDASGAADPTRVRHATSDAEGAWLVRHLPAGPYRVRFAAGTDREELAVIVRERAIVDPGL